MNKDVWGDFKRERYLLRWWLVFFLGSSVAKKHPRKRFSSNFLPSKEVYSIKRS